MTTPVDICNRALSEMGTQLAIADLGEQSPEAVQCALWYTELRQTLLRLAPWSFARRQVSLTLTGTQELNTSPYPFLAKYAYPADCIKFRYLLPVPTNINPDPMVDVGPVGVPWTPSRTYRWIIDEEPGADPDTYTKSIVTNVAVAAIGVYTCDVTNPDRWDPLFRQALTSMLAYKLVIPLSGNAGMRTAFEEAANKAILAARAVDGNEAVPTANHIPDWIAARSCGYVGGGAQLSWWGSWYSGYDDNLEWGM